MALSPPLLQIRIPLTVCPSTNTAWFGTCFVTTLPSSITSAINTLLPEGSHPDSSIIQDDIYVYFTSGSNNNLSVTFLTSTAAYANRMGYATYSTSAGTASNPVYAIQRSNPSSSARCLIAGDTWQFGQFAADTMLIFFLDSNSATTHRFWSYFGGSVTNPTSDTAVCGSPGCDHTAWAYLSDYDLTVFGWEDNQSGLGDADYNDLVLYLTIQGSGYYNEVTTYENGTLLICSNDTIVSWNSYNDVDCQPWGLLETSSGSTNCLTYMSIPSGWEWAPNDATSQAIILASYTQWDYTGTSTCYLLQGTSPTTAVGFNVSSAGVLQSCTATLGYITPGGSTISASAVTSTTSLCYNAGCSARLVLKATSESAVCAQVPRCDSTLVGESLSSSPTAFSDGVVTIPNTETVYVATGSGSVTVTAKMQLSGTDLSAPLIDVAVLTDFYVDTTTSGSGQRATIDTSWNSVQASFRSLGLNAKFAIINFVPTAATSSASYSLTSDYTFASSAYAMSSSAYHTVGCGTTTAATTQRGRNLVAAINSVATSSALDWRDDAYHVIWVHTACALPTDAASTTTNLKSIQQTTGIVPIIANGAVSSSSVSFTSNAPWTYSYYYSGASKTWDSPFRSYSASPYRGAYLMNSLVLNFQVVASEGTTSWLSNIPTSAVALSSGAASISYQIAWPSSIASTTSTLYYSATVQIIARGTIQYLIYFNHAPTLASYSTSLSASVSSVTFTMTPSDPDTGNDLNLIVVTAPSYGTLTLGATTSNTNPSQTALTAGSALAYGYYTLKYTPTSRTSDYTETFKMSVSDGCETATATVSITVAKVNAAPTASNVTISMTEDDSVSSSFTLSSYMADSDGDTTTAYLSSAAYVSSGTLRVGTLTTSTGTTTYAATTVLPSSALAYHLNLVNSLSGYGTIILPYQAYDGALYSSTAYIIINVAHKNHAPTISAVSSISAKVGSTTSFSIAVSDSDYAYSGETATIQVVASSWGTSSDAFSVDDYYGTTKYTYAGATVSTSSAFNFSTISSYAAGSNISLSGTTLTFSGFQWVAPTSGVSTDSQSVTIRAIDASGATSATTTLTFELSDSNAPVWKQYPGSVSPSQLQGYQWDGMYFSAYSENGQTDMEALQFTVVTAPSNGVAYLEDSSNNIYATALTAGFTFTPTTSGLTSYVKYNSTGVVTDFRIRYVGDSDYYGTDSISFSVSDTLISLSASNYATATFTTTRKPTVPVSANITINGYEQTTATFSITAQSTNDVSYPVYVTLESLQFSGTFLESTGSANTTWSTGTNSTASVSNGGSITGYLTGDFGVYSSSTSSPIGNFSYRVYEPTNNLVSELYWAQIYLTHVNHAPTSSAQTSRIKKRVLLSLALPASDSDADDVSSTLTAAIVSVSPYNNGPSIYYDAALTQEVNSTTIGAGKLLTDRTLYYISSDLYDSTSPLMTYQFVVYDQHGASSDPYYGYIYVSAAGDSPSPDSNLTTTAQSTMVPMSLTSDVTTESGDTPTATITSLPTKGTFTWCDDDGTCTAFTDSTTLPFALSSTTGRVTYTPRDYDWGTSFTSFTYTLTDPGTSATGTYTMVIDVTHVNQAPTIYAADFQTTTQTTAGVTINESNWRSFDWYVNDVDDLPSNLTTSVSIAFYTTNGFSIYSCAYVAGAWNSSSNCTFASTDTPEAVRSDFAKSTKVSFESYETVTGDCPDASTLKLRYGNTSRNCEAHFKFAFVPTALASYTPYVTITWTAIDGDGASSTSISALISVKALNQAPTIWAPSSVVGSGGITNPFIHDTTTTSATYDDPISVADSDSNGKTEQMTFQVVSGTGDFIFPTSASCAAVSANSSDYTCTDTISSFNTWLTNVRFNITSGTTATLLFIINDLGHSSDYSSQGNLTANATTVVTVGSSTTPTGNSSTLAIAVGVAAAAGLLTLGAAGFFLRNAVSPVTEDYFSAATAPISSAPQSPLYQAQNTEHMSPLYKGT